MKILAIETSCDETAIAVLEIKKTRSGGQKFSILSNKIASQIKIHAPFGGVVPNLAKREHQKNLPVLLRRVLKETGMHTPPSPPLLRGGLVENFPSFTRRGKGEVNKIIKPDVVAITNGPGLEPALWMGITFAKELVAKWRVPLIAINHLEGHIYASWLEGAPKFPLLALIVSGGHTELVLMKKHLDYKVLGETLDDAAGEAFDKVARMLKLPYPGGPEISKLAEKGEGGKGLFPRPMINSPDLNFSFSGLKTAVLYYLRDYPNANKSAVAYEFQEAVVDVLIAKTKKALEKYKVKSLVVGGGVAANKKLRASLEKLISDKFPDISLFLSPLWLTGDNAAMIAAAAYFKAKKKKFANPKNLKADGNLRLN